MKNFLFGIALASLMWCGVIGWLIREHAEEKVRINSEAFQESYEVKKHNKKLIVENRHLASLLKNKSVKEAKK